MPSRRSRFQFPHRGRHDGGKAPGGARHRILAMALTLAFLVIALLHVRELWEAFGRSWRTPSTFDDAYFFTRYADHLLQGWGLAWNAGGDQTYGCTSLLYALWIALLRLIPDLAFWRTIALGSWLPALATLPVLGLACARALPGKCGLHMTGGMALLGLGVMIFPSYLFHVSSGMDTTMAIFANSLLILAALGLAKSPTLERSLLAAGAVTLSWLARPDSLIYALLFPFILLAGDLIATRRRGEAASILPLARFALILVGVFSVDTLAKTLVFGHPLPLAFFAKNGGFYEDYLSAAVWNPYRFTKQFLGAQLLPLAIIILTVGRRSLALVIAALLPVALTFAYLSGVTQIMGYEARFYYPALPFFVVAAWRSLALRLDEPRPRLGRSFWLSASARVVFLVIFVAALNPLFIGAAERFDAEHAGPRPTHPGEVLYEGRVDFPQLGWLRSLESTSQMVKLCPDDTVWAMSEHGYIAAESTDLKIVDLTGLHDRNTSRGRPIADHALAQRPDVIWFPHMDYHGLLTELVSHPIFQAEYDYWPRAFDYGLAILREGERADAVRRAYAETWTRVYRWQRPPPPAKLR